MTERDRKRESGNILEHMPLEEVRIEDIGHIDPPAEWDPEVHEREPHVPPVLIEETFRNRDGKEETDTELPKYSILAQHRSFWRNVSKGHLSIKALVVRSGVHISLAHESITNCVEEALLFEGLLRNELVENRSRLSDLLGYSRARITQILNLLKLPEEMRRKLLLTDSISEFQLRPLIRVTDVTQQAEMFGKLIDGKLTGRQMALFASGRQVTDQVATEKSTSAKPGERIPDIEELIASDISAKEAEEPSSISTASKSANGKRGRINGGGPRLHAMRINELLLTVGSLRDSGWEIRARELGISELDIILFRGIALLRSGLYSESIEMLEIAIENDQDNAPAHFYLGRCLNLTGALPAAEGYLRTALELVPDHPDYLVELAIVLEKLKRNAEAATFYRRAGVLRKKFPEVSEK